MILNFLDDKIFLYGWLSSSKKKMCQVAMALKLKAQSSAQDIGGGVKLIEQSLIQIKGGGAMCS